MLHSLAYIIHIKCISVIFQNASNAISLSLPPTESWYWTPKA